MAKLTAPIVKAYIDRLESMSHGGLGSTVTFDDESYRLLDVLFDHLEQLEPSHENGARRLWLKVDRGPIEDFADFEEWVEEGYVANREEFEQEWLGFFPDETSWLELVTLHDRAVGYKVVQARHRIIIECAPEKGEGFPYDIHEFMEWLVEAVDEAIEAIKVGIYNDDVANNLPPKHRIGTILRSALWDADPEEREAFFKDLSQEDVQEFCQLIEQGPVTGPMPHSFTANEFYHCCALGYKACGYDVAGLTPSAMYDKYADGRDEGLGEIEPDSPEAFLDWLEDSRQHGGHPWEVCRGGNSTHVSFGVYHDVDGFHLTVAGRAYTRCVEAIKFFLAIHRAGYPVSIADGALLRSRLNGSELVGIVPEGVFPRYCENYFSDESIHSFINLTDEDDVEQLLPHCVWQAIPEARLRSQEGDVEI